MDGWLATALTTLATTTAIGAPPLADQPETERGGGRLADQPAVEPRPAPADAGVPTAPDSREIHFEFRFRGEFGFNAKLSGSPGDLSVSRAGAGVTAAIPIGSGGTFYPGYDFEVSEYDFSGATGLIAGSSDPWGTVHRHAIKAAFVHKATAHWTWAVGGDLTWAAEDGGDLADALTGGAFGALRYTMSDGLTLGLGGGFRTRVEDDAIVYPVIDVDWRLADGWRIEGGWPRVALLYEPRENLTVSLEAEYETRDFRLADDGPLPGGAAQEDRLPVSLGVSYTPTPAIVVSARVGAYAFGSLDVWDAGGTKTGDADIDPAAFLMLICRVRF